MIISLLLPSCDNKALLYVYEYSILIAFGGGMLRCNNMGREIKRIVDTRSTGSSLLKLHTFFCLHYYYLLLHVYLHHYLYSSLFHYITEINSLILPLVLFQKFLVLATK